VKRYLLLAALFLILIVPNVFAADVDLKNITAYYNLDTANISGTTVIDVTGSLNGNFNGTRSNTNSSNGIINEGRGFPNSANQYITLTGLDETEFTNQFTVSTWLQKTAVAPATRRAIFEQDGGGTDTIALNILFNNTVLCKMGGSAGFSDVYSNITMQNNTLTHIVCRWTRNGNHELFINGKPAGVRTGKDAVFPTIPDFRIGEYSGGGILKLQGILDELGFWRVALDNTNISNLYNNGSGCAYPFNNCAAAPPSFTPFDRSVGNTTNNASTFETDTQYFSVEVSLNQTRYSNATATLIYNNSNYTANQITSTLYANGIRNYTFQTSVIIPLVSANATNLVHNWSVTFINATTSSPNATDNTANKNQRVDHAYLLKTLLSANVLETDLIKTNLSITKILDFTEITTIFSYKNVSLPNKDIIQNTTNIQVWNSSTYSSLNSDSQAIQNNTILATVNLRDTRTGSATNRTKTITQLTYIMDVEECGTGAIIQNISYRDIGDLQLTPASSTATYDLFIDKSRGNRTKVVSLSAKKTHAVCMVNTIPTGLSLLNDLSMVSTAAGFSSINFFQNNNSITGGARQNITLYFASGTNNITIEVVDQDENPLRNHIVIAERFLTTNNTFFQTDSDVTDINGNVKLQLNTGNNEYRFIIKNPSGTTLLTSVQFKILESTYRFRVTLVQFDILQNIQGFRNLPHNLTYNNDTKMVNFNWSDSAGISRDICLKVQKFNASSVNILFDACTTNMTGVYLFNLSGHINGTFQAIAYGHAATSGALFNIDILDILDEIEQPFRQLGLLLGFFIILLMGGLAMTGNPATLIMVSALGLVFAVITQMWIIGFSVVAGLIFIGILAAIKSRV